MTLTIGLQNSWKLMIGSHRQVLSGSSTPLKGSICSAALERKISFHPDRKQNKEKLRVFQLRHLVAWPNTTTPHYLNAPILVRLYLYLWWSSVLGCLGQVLVYTYYLGLTINCIPFMFSKMSWLEQ